jgi:superfamily II DNA/RNA helicase
MNINNLKMKSINTKITSIATVSNDNLDEDGWHTPSSSKVSNDNLDEDGWHTPSSSKVSIKELVEERNENSWDELVIVNEKETIKQVIPEPELKQVIQEPETVDSFEKMNLDRQFLKAIYTAGFQTPSPCQRNIPLMQTDRDVVLQGETGSGKTLTFLIAAIDHIMKNGKDINELQGVCIAPTRELALQIYNVAETLTSNINVSVALHRGVGKDSHDADRYRSNKKANVIPGHEQIIIGTPGRLKDIMTSNRINLTDSIRITTINTDYIGLIIIDEADELLASRETDTLIDIFRAINTFEYSRKIIISATMPRAVLDICNKFLDKPIEILLNNKEVAKSSSIQHYYVNVDDENKLPCLIDLLGRLQIHTVIIFAGTLEKVLYIYRGLLAEKFPVACIHGTLKQGERDSIIEGFTKGSIRILVASDLIARGIDIQSVSIVFNWDIPKSKDNYKHRSGRAGRFGRFGKSVILTSNISEIRSLSEFHEITINELPESFN